MSHSKLIFLDEQKPKAAEKIGNQSKNMLYASKMVSGDVTFEQSVNGAKIYLYF